MFYQLNCLALTKNMSLHIQQKRSFTHSGQVSCVCLCRWSVPSAYWSWQTTALLEIRAIIVSGFHGWLQMGVGCFYISNVSLWLHFLFLFDRPFSTNDSLLLLSIPTTSSHWWRIRWSVTWKCCLSSRSILPNYLLMSPACLYKSLSLCLDGGLSSRDYFAGTHVVACAFVTAVSTSESCSVTQTAACSLLTQINSAIQLPLGCTLTLGHATCPNQKVTGKIWWVI